MSRRFLYMSAVKCRLEQTVVPTSWNFSAHSKVDRVRSQANFQRNRRRSRPSFSWSKIRIKYIGKFLREQCYSLESLQVRWSIRIARMSGGVRLAILMQPRNQQLFWQRHVDQAISLHRHTEFNDAALCTLYVTNCHREQTAGPRSTNFESCTMRSSRVSILQTMTDGEIVIVANAWKVACGLFRLAYLHLTLAHYESQGQGS